MLQNKSFNKLKSLNICFLYLYYLNLKNKLRIFCVLKKKKRNFNIKYCDFKQILKGMFKKISDFGRKKVSNCWLSERKCRFLLLSP